MIHLSALRWCKIRGNRSFYSDPGPSPTGHLRISFISDRVSAEPRFLTRPCATGIRRSSQDRTARAAADPNGAISIALGRAAPALLYSTIMYFSTHAIVSGVSFAFRALLSYNPG